MEQEVLIYNNEVLKTSHLYENYLTTLAKVSLRDYNNDYGFSNDVFALDIDSAETDKFGSNNKTMDAAIGIANYKNNKTSYSRILLVELRMNYTGQAHNARTSDMKSKDSYTRSLLSGCNIDQYSYFIFKKEVASQKNSIIKRESIVDSSLKKWVILSPDEFINKFHFVRELPYKPESPIDDIKKEALDFINALNFENAIKHIYHWLEKVDEYCFQYKIEECKALITVIEEILSVINNLSEDARLDIEIIEKEKIPQYKNYIIMKENP